MLIEVDILAYLPLFIAKVNKKGHLKVTPRIAKLDALGIALIDRLNN